MTFDERWSRVRRDLRRARRLRPADVAATSHALLWAGVVEALIRWVPLPRLARLAHVRVALLAAPSGPDGGPESDAAAGPAFDARDQRRYRAARRVMRRWPFGAGRCLRSSLVLGRLLDHHDPVLHLGVGRAGDDLEAHAWLAIGGHAVLSDNDATPFRRFAPDG